MRVKRGPLSIASRIKEAAIDSYSEHLAKVYANSTPSESDLARSMNLFAGQQPQVFLTQEEVVKQNRQRLNIEYGRKQIITDVTRKVLGSMTPRERLEVANGGPLPTRFVLKPCAGGDDE
jgi:hypothetical protein